MFRTHVNLSCRMVNAIAMKATCRVRVCSTADDVTKFATGLQAIQQRHYNRYLPHLQIASKSNVSFLHLNHLQCGAGVSLYSPNFVSHMPQHLSQHVVQFAHYSTGADSNQKKTKGAADSVTSSETTTASGEVEEKLTIFQRFKRTYKEHGKILIAVHVATSIVWYGSFYVAVRCGIDIVPWLEHWGFSEWLIKPFRAGGVGDFALAYLMYKLATPARYTVTIAGTNMAIRVLRSRGQMAPKCKEDSIRQLYKEGKKQVVKNSKLRKDRLVKLKAAREKRKAERLKKKQQGS